MVDTLVGTLNEPEKANSDTYYITPHTKFVQVKMHYMIYESSRDHRSR